jgi:hypothetical protein
MGRVEDPTNAKKALGDLVTKKLAESQTGRQGGYWLTPMGRCRAEKLMAQNGA